MSAPPKDLVFYDGDCGLCHRAVTFLVARDVDGSRFVYAPLGGTTFSERIQPDHAHTLPDSLIVLTSGGDLLTRSGAVIHLLLRLGAGWRMLGRVARRMPTGLLDRAYDGVAAIRSRLFTPPGDTCPVLPEQLRAQFLP